MRTINVIRQSIGLIENEEPPTPEDEAIRNFIAAASLGKIYYRTALAWKAQDEKGEARKLLRVAKVYLPQDEHVAREIAACALRLG